MSLFLVSGISVELSTETAIGVISNHATITTTQKAIRLLPQQHQMPFFQSWMQAAQQQHWCKCDGLPFESRSSSFWHPYVPCYFRHCKELTSFSIMAALLSRWQHRLCRSGIRSKRRTKRASRRSEVYNLPVPLTSIQRSATNPFKIKINLAQGPIRKTSKRSLSGLFNMPYSCHQVYDSIRATTSTM